MKTVLSLVSGALLSVLVGCTSDSQTATQAAEAPAAAATQTPAAPRNATPQTILFFGNSITAGLGVEPDEAFPALIGQKLDSAGLAYTIVNAGLSGETTAGGRSRVGWVLRQPVAVFVLELGGNDGLRGLPLTDTRRNLQAIIDTVRRRSPEAQIVLAGMQIPPNLGPDYATQFKKLYAEIAQKNQVKLIPFLLEGVGGVAKFNQRDGIHPTPAGHRLVARNVWTVLQPMLRQPAAVAQ
ncbi:acyl-CoA thioesterase-1 [Hymenobacter gelipurpurascens]|uniref:Acyl-CoA thioesterase-1 n=1 Tax=Hymenobacter gelipurpurascens TaxID=89968 RepID=A0A212UEH4_9BACT|nr:arylesterase [Hymenobacter gelipurpurascens]SNC76583.1 acyl-CoA thioesterase-1 [Hymenobacter gelipurpurascens]